MALPPTSPQCAHAARESSSAKRPLCTPANAQQLQRFLLLCTLTFFPLSLSLFLFSPLIVRFFHLFRSLESFSYSLPRDFLRNLTFFSLSKMRFSVFFVFVYFLSVRWLLELLLESSSPSESLSQRKIEILQDDEDDDEITFFVVFWLFTQTLSSLFLFLPLKNFF